LGIEKQTLLQLFIGFCKRRGKESRRGKGNSAGHSNSRTRQPDALEARRRHRLILKGNSTATKAAKPQVTVSSDVAGYGI
jgi:hypothetical protein